MMRTKYVDVSLDWRPHISRRSERWLQGALDPSGLFMTVYRDGVRGDLDKWPSQEDGDKVIRLVKMAIGRRRLSGWIAPLGWNCGCENCLDISESGDVNTLGCPPGGPDSGVLVHVPETS